jgi:hypothetical protein
MLVERALLVIVVATAVALGLAGGAGSSPLGCGATINQDVVLTQDITGCGEGLSVVGSGLVIDMNGHSLSGSGGSAGFEIRGDAVTLEDGTVSGFSTGVLVRGRAAVVSTMTITRNRTLGVCVCTTGAAGARLVDDVISHNAGTGIFFDSGAAANFLGNDTVDANGVDGVFAPFGVDATRYEGNRFTNNGRYGIFIDTASSQVVGNMASGNGAAGIHVFELFPGFSSGYLIASNVADRNGGLGIEAPANAAGESPRDGGGNAAKHNGDPAECLNIVCGYNRGQARITNPGPMLSHPAR